jgi:serine protease Do
VVGINTAIFGRAAQGIGFAIPSDLAKKVYQLLRTSGITRGWIGVALQNLNKPLADRLGLPDARGALIAEVMPDSPAERAGLRPGDVIVQWDDKPIDNSNDLRIAVAQTKPGSNVPVAFYRDKKKQETTIAVAERPSQLSQ